jgi:hypothetical protein
MGANNPRPPRGGNPQPGETWRRYDGALVRIVERTWGSLGRHSW